MQDKPSKKVLEILAWPPAIVGALTAVFTIGAWVIDSADTAYKVIQVGGLVYVAAWLTVFGRKVVRGKLKPGARIGLAFLWCLVVLGLFLIAPSWKDRNEVLLFFLGLAGGISGLGIAIGRIGQSVVDRKEEKRLEAMAKWKECLDCAEMIRAKAKVCHYCGFRYEPKPFGVAEISADAEARPEPDAVASGTSS